MSSVSKRQGQIRKTLGLAASSESLCELGITEGGQYAIAEIGFMFVVLGYCLHFPALCLQYGCVVELIDTADFDSAQL